MEDSNAYSLDDQYRAVLSTVRIFRLIVLDSIWTKHLETKKQPQQEDRETLQLIGSEMLSLMSQTIEDSQWLLDQVNSSPETFKDSATQAIQKSSLAEDEKKQLLEFLSSKGGMAPFIQSCTNGIAESMPDEIEDITAKLIIISSGKHTHGTLKQSTKCFLVGVAFGAATMYGASGNVPALVGAFGTFVYLTDNCG